MMLKNTIRWTALASVVVTVVSLVLGSAPNPDARPMAWYIASFFCGAGVALAAVHECLSYREERSL